MIYMSGEKLKDRRITIRTTEKMYNDFADYISKKSNKIGTKLTQSQAFEILLNNAEKYEKYERCKSN